MNGRDVPGGLKSPSLLLIWRLYGQVVQCGLGQHEIAATLVGFRHFNTDLNKINHQI